MKITDFVVGLGFDASDFDKGMKAATQQIGSFKSTVLQAGAALGAALTLKGMTFDFSKQVIQLKQLGDYLGISATRLSALQQTAKTFAVPAEEMDQLLVSFSRAKAGLQKGQLGLFDNLAKSGVNIDELIGAKDAEEMLYKLSDQVKRLGKDSRINTDLSPETIYMLKEGRTHLKALTDQYADIRPVTEKATKASQDFVKNFTELETWTGRYSDKISTGVLAGLDKVVEKTNDWVKANQDLLDSGFDKAAQLIEDNVGAIAAALGALTVGGTLVGLGKVAGSIRGIGKAAEGALVGVGRLGGLVGFVASLAFVNPEDIFGEKIGKFLNMTPGEFLDWLSGLGKQTPENSAALGAEGTAYQVANDEAPDVAVDATTATAPEPALDYQATSSEGAAVSAPAPVTPIAGNSVSAPVAAKPAPTPAPAQQGMAQINNSVVVKIGNESLKRVVRQEVGDVFKVGGAKFSVGADF